MTRRRYFHYTEWEDYQAGLYRRDAFTPKDVTAAAGLLGNGQSCLDAMRRVVTEWPKATEQQLCEMGQNRRAWLGQAACCIALGVTDSATKEAWWTLSETQQNTANAIADTVIWGWERERHGAQTLFEVPPDA